jgi:hypothetical protein
MCAVWLSLAACTATAPIPGQFPKPVVEPLPLRVGIRYSDEFKNYVFRQRIRGEQGWVVMMGSANEAMFDQVLAGMFRETVDMDDPEVRPSAKRNLDAYIEPEVESFEFAAPMDWDTDVFTVWITYRLNVYDADSRLVASWPVRAYGQSRHNVYNFLSADDALAEATTVAMRDAGAYVAIYFEDEPRIREWLREEGRAAKRERRKIRALEGVEEE